MALATVEEWKLWAADNTTYFTNAEGDSLDDVIGDAIDAASRRVENDCGRSFELTEAEVRYFRVEDDGTIRFVDLVADTIVEVLYDNDMDDEPDQALAETDYQLMPLTDERGKAPTRYQWMRRRTGSALWPAPGTVVSIEADWGYVEDDESPPPDIVQATIIMAGRLFARREAKLGTVSVPQMGTVGVIKGPDQDYLDLIRPYVRSDAIPGYAVT
jgi:hypothetical protein